MGRISQMHMRTRFARVRCCHRGSAFHYRDKIGLEADAVISLDDGRWALVEVKLGSRQIEDAAKHFKKLSDRIDQDKEGTPSFLMVLTGTAVS